jgi:hypothetical protein
MYCDSWRDNNGRVANADDEKIKNSGESSGCSVLLAVYSMLDGTQVKGLNLYKY